MDIVGAVNILARSNSTLFPMRRILLALVIIAASSLSAVAQYDLTTIDGTIHALYESISGPEGFEVDRETFDPMFTENARLSAAYVDRDGNAGYISWTAPEYVETVWNGPRARGFFEIETYQVVEEFGSVVHVFSTYESRWNEDDEEPFQRGINSIQFVKRDGSYKIVSILWQGETEADPIPAQYLPQD